MKQCILSTHYAHTNRTGAWFYFIFWPHTNHFVPPSALLSCVCVAFLLDCTYAWMTPLPWVTASAEVQHERGNMATGRGRRGLHKRHNVAIAETSRFILWGGRNSAIAKKQTVWMCACVRRAPPWKVETPPHGWMWCRDNDFSWKKKKKAATCDCNIPFAFAYYGRDVRPRARREVVEKTTAFHKIPLN